MENLLLNNFPAHYALTGPIPAPPVKTTTAAYFELRDDTHLIYFNMGEGIAPHKNDNQLQVKVINYEDFHNNLPHAFKRGRNICDLIAYTTQAFNYFSLNELTDTDPNYIVPFTNSKGSQFGKRLKAIHQLESTLISLCNVPDIKSFVERFVTMRCCFFNKQVNPPVTQTVTITAPLSFARVNAINEEGFEMSHPGMEALGFKLFEYSGGKAAKII